MEHSIGPGQYFGRDAYVLPANNCPATYIEKRFPFKDTYPDYTYLSDNYLFTRQHFWLLVGVVPIHCSIYSSFYKYDPS